MRSIFSSRRAVTLVALVLAAAQLLFSQHPLLKSGPMLGYVEMKEVLLWVQTTQEAVVFFEYWDKENPQERFLTDPVTTAKPMAFTAKCIADRVEPGRAYIYQLYINKEPVRLPYPTEFKTQPLWRWRADPPVFTVAAGSCAYVNEPRYDRPGSPYGSNYAIFDAIAQQKPELMLWLGDNIYLREADWYTRTGIFHRYTHARSLPELQRLLAATHHYAIWDDHDYGPNDSDGTWINKDIAWEAFQAFWGNPTFGLPGQKGCTTQFQYADVDFFLLDNRYYRTPNDCKTCPCTVLGKAQLDWIRGALAASQAPYKVVAMGGQFLNTYAGYETYANLCPAERDSLLAFIEREGIQGVLFLTGDRHHSELSAYKNARGHWVYELTTSPLTSGVNTGAAREINRNRVEGTLVTQHNFALLRFSGPRTQRQVELSLLSTAGEVLWKRTILPSGELAQE